VGLLKDWKEDNSGYRFQTQVAHFFDPREWLRLQKWRTQRANRGWSDRDTWGAGDHIARMTAEMLTRLRDHTYVDWDAWFDLNVKEEGKNVYKNLTEVIEDITKYLDFEETSWADGLDTRRDSVDEIFKKRSDQMYEYIGPDWYEGEKKLSEAAIKHRINKWHKEEQKLYKKAQKAMSFFSRNFSAFWD
jgi:hypothetical protein